MIIITNEIFCNYSCEPGDEFSLIVEDHTGIKERIKEKIIKSMTISYICSFRFCDEDGTMRSPNLSGFFGDKNNLPLEIKNAKKLDELTYTQIMNLEKSNIT